MLILTNIENDFPTGEEEAITVDFLNKLVDNPTGHLRAPVMVGLNESLMAEYGFNSKDVDDYKEAKTQRKHFSKGLAMNKAGKTCIEIIERMLYLVMLPGLYFLPTNLLTCREAIRQKKGVASVKRLDEIIKRLKETWGTIGGEITQRNFMRAISFFAHYSHLFAPDTLNIPDIFFCILLGQGDYKVFVALANDTHNGNVNLSVVSGSEQYLPPEYEELRLTPFCRLVEKSENGLNTTGGQNELVFWKEINEIKQTPADQRPQDMKDQDAKLQKYLTMMKLGNVDKTFWDGSPDLDYGTIDGYDSSVLQMIEDEAQQVTMEEETFDTAIAGMHEAMATDEMDGIPKVTRAGMAMFEGTSRAEFKVWHDENRKYFIGERNLVLNRKTKTQHMMTNVDHILFSKYILEPQNITDDLGKFMAEVQMVGCLRELDQAMKSQVVIKKELYSKDGKVKKKTITFKDKKYEETATHIPIATGAGVVMLIRANVHEFFKQCMLAWAKDHGFAATRKYLEMRLQNYIIRAGFFQNMFYPRYNDTLPPELKDNNTLCLYQGCGNIGRHTGFGLGSSGILHAIEKARNVTPGPYQAQAIAAIKKRIVNDNQAKLVEMYLTKVSMPTGVIKGLFRSFLIIPPIQNNMFRTGIYMPKLFFSPYGHYLSFMKYYETQPTVVLNAEKNITWRDIEYLLMTSFYLDDLGVMKACLGKTFKRSDIKNFISEEIRPVTDKEFSETKYIAPVRSSGHVSNRVRGQVLPVVKAGAKRKMVGEFSIFDEDIKTAQNQGIGGGYESYEVVFKKLMQDVDNERQNPREMCSWVNDKVIKVTPMGEFFSSDYKPKKAREDMDM